MGEGRHRKDEEAVAPAKKKRGPWRIVLVVAIIVLACSLGGLAFIGFSYWQGQQKYDDIARMAGLEELDAIDIAVDEAEELPALTVDWDALRAANPETVAWVYMPGTPINYPVVQTDNNDKYLTVDFDGDAGWLANYGAIFLDYRNDPDFKDKANFIYGHHMNDGSMFAELAALGNQERFDECRTVYLLTPSKNHRLRTFALVHVGAYDPIVQTEFSSTEEFREYVQQKKDYSIVYVDDAPDAEDIGRVYAFATCDEYGGGRYVLFAYEQAADAEGLSGTLGMAEEDGQVVGFDEEFSEE